METTINFYHDSYQFEKVITDLNVNSDFIEMKLAKAYEYNPMKGDWWATVIQNSKEIARYNLQYGEGLFEVNFH
jgi:hypothetical protein